MRVASILALVLVPSLALAQAKPPSLASLVPPNAVSALLIERDGIEIVRKSLETQPALRTELGQYLQRKLGFDPFLVTGIAGWVEGYTPPRGSVYLRGPKLVGKADLAPLVVTNAPGGVLLQHAPTGVAPGPATPLGKLLQEAGNADVVWGIVDFSIDPSVAEMAKQYKLEAARLVFGKNTIRAEVVGDPQKLEMIGKMVIGALAVASEKIAQEREKALAKPDVTVEGAMAIWTYHQMATMQKELEPRIAGNHLVFEYKLPDFNKYASNAAMPVAVIGMLAAVAIPSFTKYVKRSKVSEARLNVMQIARLMQARDLAKKPNPKFKFAGIDWTPATACAQQPNQKCTGVSGAAWQQLGFTLDTPHYYQYRIVSKGAGKQAAFTVEARGDLDGNGVFSRFAVDGTLNDDGSIALAPIVIENENE